MSRLRHTLGLHLKNIPGWRTDRKIVVIESDDWGSIRMPSLEVFQKLQKHGIRVDKCPYNRYDSLASEEDLEALFDVLIQYKDKNGNHPVITANTIVANPDFPRIRNSGFSEYYYEPFTDTLKRYAGCGNAFNLWVQGLEEKIFFPQFHGREHLNVPRWLKSLRDQSEETRLTFDFEMFGISTEITKENRLSYLAALDFDTKADLEWQKEMLADGLNLFEVIFGYRSDSFIAANYTWHSEIEHILFQKGIKYIQGAGMQKIPDIPKPKFKRHFFGQKNAFGQLYLTRNCIFEPSSDEGKDWVSACLREISTAFLWNKPAVISSHRLNFIGSIDNNNRTRNLKTLDSLLTSILKRWPQTEFMTTSELGSLVLA